MKNSMTKNLRILLFSIISALLSFIMLYVFYGELLPKTDKILFSKGGDGLKSYYASQYHLKYDTDYLHTDCMNYPYGEFSFYSGEDCEFDFIGLEGNYADDPYVDDIVYIVDDLDYGKGGIEYECFSFGVGSTYGDGSFDYNENDQCVFYL